MVRNSWARVALIAPWIVALQIGYAFADEMFWCVDKEGIKRLRNYACGGDERTFVREGYRTQNPTSVTPSDGDADRHHGSLTRGQHDRLEYGDAVIARASRYAPESMSPGNRATAIARIAEVLSSLSGGRLDRLDYAESVIAQLASNLPRGMSPGNRATAIANLAKVYDPKVGGRPTDAGLKEDSPQITGFPAPGIIPAPIPAPRPSAIIGCNGGGCWDDLGNRYNGGSGGTYFGPNGVCQLVGGMMQCP